MTDRRAVAVDLEPTDDQFQTAVRLSRLHETEISLVQGFGEKLSIANESFDFAISEYGAALWPEPYQCFPEVSRVLEPNSSVLVHTDYTISSTTDIGRDEPDEK